MTTDVSTRTATRTSRQRAIWRATSPLRGAVVAGAIAGFVAAGIGSRLVMRVIAMVDSDSNGAGTDAGAAVGDVTLSGTFQLLVLGMILGSISGLVYLGLRRWLYVPPIWRGAAFSIVTLFTVGNVLFDTHNPDFQIFEPVILVIALFVALFFVNGLMLGALAHRIHPEPSYPPGKLVPRFAVVAIVLVTVFGFTGFAESVGQMIDDEGSCISVIEPGAGCGVVRTTSGD
jgi:hypothetical protein